MRRRAPADHHPLRIVLLGDPVAGSRSPFIHAAAFAATGIEGRYEAIRADAARLEVTFSDIRSGALDGANITMPHKARAAELADHLGEDAQRAGAVNTIAMAHGRLAGWNTDVAALRMALAQSFGPVLILGAGGAAAAAAVAAADRDPAVSARNQQSAGDFARRFGFPVVPWGEAVGGATLINATPIGANGEPLPQGLIEQAVGLIDLAYGTQPTPAVAEAQRRGLLVVDGIELLVAQAAESFEIWTGIPAPLEAMRRAARER